MLRLLLVEALLVKALVIDQYCGIADPEIIVVLCDVVTSLMHVDMA